MSVGRDTLEMILQAGINAPNGMNKQSWEIRVVDNPAVLESIKDAMAQANPGKKMARDCFRGSEGYKMIICVGFGYADESPKAKPRDNSKYRFVEP